MSSSGPLVHEEAEQRVVGVARLDAEHARQVRLRVEVDAGGVDVRDRANAASRFSAVVVLPTPPFWLNTAMMAIVRPGR